MTVFFFYYGFVRNDTNTKFVEGRGHFYYLIPILVVDMNLSKVLVGLAIEPFIFLVLAWYISAVFPGIKCSKNRNKNEIYANLI